MMRILLIAGLAMLAMPVSAAPGTSAKFQVPSVSAMPDNCPKVTAYQAHEGGKTGAPRKLGELPGAHQFAAVYRTIDGCQVPLIVRYNVDR